MAKRILIVGGGLAGTIIANGLCRRLGTELRCGDVNISMLSTTDKHLYQPGLLYVPFGRFREQELSRDQKSVLDRRVNFYVDPAKHIDIQNRAVTTASGRIFLYDYIVLATGSHLNIDSVPGLREGAHWFYDLPGAKKLRSALCQFQGGKVVVNVNPPHKCPVAPLEMIFMLHDHFKERGMRDKVELTYTYPIGRVHSLEPVAHWAVPEFERLDIKYQTFFNTAEVDVANKIIKSEEGDELPYDLLITIPPHKGAAVIEESGLGKSGWVPTNPKTLLMDGTDNVFVCGDTTNIPISKAGSTAHFEADVIVENLAHMLQEGCWARDYDGKVFCFVATGLSTGTYVWFNYTTPPKPMAPTQMVHWFKLAYNRMYWLSASGLL